MCGPFGVVRDAAARLVGSKVRRVESASEVSPSTSRWVGGGPVEEAPDLSNVCNAESPKART